MIYGPLNGQMVPEQLKQWHGLAKELYMILSFLDIGHSTQLINLPMEEFFRQGVPISKNAFARLITVTSHMRLVSYFAVFI